MTLIDSLKRLERAGSENSRATAKLHQAVREVADLIEHTVPHNVMLPWGYIVEDRESNIGATTLLFRRSDEYDEWTGKPILECVDYDGGRWLHGDFNADMTGYGQTREVSLRFAADIASGLLDEIATFIEARGSEAEEAAKHLEAVAR